MDFGRAVDGDAHGRDIRLFHLARDLVREAASARDHGHRDATLADCAYQRVEIVSQKRFPSVHAHFTNPEIGQLPNELETGLRVEFVGRSAAGARAAEAAGLIAAKGDLPHRVGGAIVLEGRQSVVGSRFAHCEIARGSPSGESQVGRDSSTSPVWVTPTQAKNGPAL